jgi:hypothetical protein
VTLILNHGMNNKKNPPRPPLSKGGWGDYIFQLRI